MAKLELTEEQKRLFNALPRRLQQETALAFIASGYKNKKQSYLSACKKLKQKPSKNPETSGSEILSNPNVTAFVDSVRIVVAESVNIDAAWVLMSAKKVFDRCMQFEKVIDIEDRDSRVIWRRRNNEHKWRLIYR